jgi:KDO2-lipid IV(A) lauroyltransferase
MNRARPRHVLEYVFLRALACLLNAIPYRAALFVGWLLAAAAHRVFAFRRQTAYTRIRTVFGCSLPEARVRAIAWQSWRNIVFSGIELLREHRMTRDRVRTAVDCAAAMDALARHAATGKGAVVACPHMGNWELAAVASHLHGIPVFSIAAPQKNPLTDAYLNRLRQAPGIATFARGSGLMRQVLRRLHGGGFLAILPDVRVRDEGVAVAFLGGTANVGTGMARFARHCGIPIFPAVVTRQGWTRHTIVVHPPILPDPSMPADADVRRMTGQVMAIFDCAIHADPGQWFWFNRRWVLDPLYPDTRTSR